MVASVQFMGAIILSETGFYLVLNGRVCIPALAPSSGLTLGLLHKLFQV